MKNKLTVILVVLLFISVIFAIRQVSEKERARAEVERLKSTELLKEEALREIEVTVWETCNAVMYYLNRPSEISSNEFESQIQDMEMLRPLYKSHLESPERKQTFAEFEEMWADAQSRGRELVRLRDEMGSKLSVAMEAVRAADDVIDFKILSTLESAARTAGDARRSKIRLITEIEEGLWEASNSVVNFASDGGEVARRQEFDKQVAEIEKEFGEYASLSLSVVEQAHLEELKSSWENARELLTSTLQLHGVISSKTLDFWEVVHASDDIIDFKLQAPLRTGHPAPEPE